MTRSEGKVIHLTLGTDPRRIDGLNPIQQPSMAEFENSHVFYHIGFARSFRDMRAGWYSYRNFVTRFLGPVTIVFVESAPSHDLYGYWRPI